MSENSIYDQLQGPRDPWEYEEMGYITPHQARAREQAGRVTVEHEIEAAKDVPAAKTRPSRQRPAAIPVSQLSVREKRIRDARPGDKPAPSGTADRIVLNEPGAIGLPDQTVEASTRVEVEAAFAKLAALTQPSREVSSESAEAFFTALHNGSHQPPQS